MKKVFEESGVIRRGGRVASVLLAPVPYGVAHGSLGFHAAYHGLNSNDCYCERAVFDNGAPKSIETGRALTDFDVIFVTLAWEIEALELVKALRMAGVEPDRGLRPDDQPMIIAGGPLTFSNPHCLYPVADAIFVGEADDAFERITAALSQAGDRQDALVRMDSIPGMWVPAISDHCPELHVQPKGFFPQHTRVITSDTTFGGAFLVEVGRGCIRRCAYCVVSGARVRPRFVDPDRVLSVIPDGVKHVGLIAPAVSYHPGLADILRPLVNAGTLVTVSSMAADGINDEALELLAKGGLRTITTAADGASQRLRGLVNRKVSDRELIAFARRCRDVGIRRVKLYLILGLPDETDSDLAEFAELAGKMAGYVSLTVSVGPLIPKKNTALGSSVFPGKAEIKRKYKKFRRIMPNGVRISFASIRDAVQEARLAALTRPGIEDLENS